MHSRKVCADAEIVSLRQSVGAHWRNCLGSNKNTLAQLPRLKYKNETTRGNAIAREQLTSYSAMDKPKETMEPGECHVAAYIEHGERSQ
jgi:hypothetical protein